MMDPGRLHVEVHGPDVAPTIVLVHGAPDRSGGFRPLLPHLSDRRVVVYDRRGYGRSVDARPATSMADHAHDLLGVLERFEPPRVVVAHSFGANPTMLAATFRPHAFAALGLWEPPLPWLDWWPQSTKDYNTRVAHSADPAQDVEAIYRQLLADAWDRLTPQARAKRRAEGAAFQLDMSSELVAPFAFEDVAVPTLVGYGSATSPEHARGSSWLSERLPDARLHVVPGVGHFAHRTHPDLYAGFTIAATSLVAGPDVSWSWSR